MVATRSSTTSPNEHTPDKSNGTKRKADSSPSPASRRGKKAGSKEQKTLEETLSKDEEDHLSEDAEMKAAVETAESSSEAKSKDAASKGEPHTESKAQSNGKSTEGGSEHAVETQIDDKQKPSADIARNGQRDTQGAQTEGAVEESKSRRAALPSNILEKGIIYFFMRGRVDTNNPESVQDIARSYLVLRPLPDGAKLNDGPIQDFNNNRLLALPKKVLPKSSQDRFMVFVEKVHIPIEKLKSDFMRGSEYSTQTSGVRQTPPVTPIGEGVYAITTTGRESHLAYMLSIPAELGDVQEEMGLKERGSFILSLKNPKSSGPANTNLPQGANFTHEIMEKFRGRSWMPPTPQHLDFVNAQLLLIGEGMGDIKSATEATSKDEKDEEKDTPLENIEKLQHEDQQRTENMAGDDSVFEDLGISKKEFPKVPTTW